MAKSKLQANFSDLTDFTHSVSNKNLGLNAKLATYSEAEFSVPSNVFNPKLGCKSQTVFSVPINIISQNLGSKCQAQILIPSNLFNPIYQVWE